MEFQQLLNDNKNLIAMWILLYLSATIIAGTFLITDWNIVLRCVVAFVFFIGSLVIKAE